MSGLAGSDGFAEVLASGRAQEQAAHLESALALYQEALATVPDAAQQSELQRAIGRIHLRRCAFHAAEAALARAVALTPEHPLALTSWGCCLQLLGRHDDALAAHERALAIDPLCQPARINLASDLLLLGRYDEAWPHYEARLESLVGIAVPATMQRWQGTTVPPELIVVAEQGIGDLIQFCRYAPLLQLVSPVVSLVADCRVHPLLQQAQLFHRLYAPELAFQPESGAEWLPLMALPQLMNLTSEHVLLDAPYLHPEPHQVTGWADRFGPSTGLRVAIGWQGNPGSEREGHAGRSMPLELLAPLAELEGVELVSLQKGPGSEQLAGCSFRHRFTPLQSQVDETWDLLETLAILASCDLVISTDTALAHLAAAMGKPTWILLKAVPDWRWGLEGDTTPWYPSARLFRQTAIGDWPGVVARVREALGQ